MRICNINNIKTNIYFLHIFARSLNLEANKTILKMKKTIQNLLSLNIT